MNNIQTLNAGFSPQDVYECTAHGKLWLIAKVHRDKWGLYRMRRAGAGQLKVDGALTWRKQWGPFAGHAVRGHLIFTSNAGTDVLIDLTKQKDSHSVMENGDINNERPSLP